MGGFIGVIFWKFTKMSKKLDSLSSTLYSVQTDISHDIRIQLEEIDEEIQDVNGEIRALFASIHKIEQASISWLTTSKTLPPSCEMVLVLDLNKEEWKGFLADDKETWTILKGTGTMHKIGFEQVTHWKKVINN